MNITVEARPNEREFLPARKVWERYGVTSMTLHRWLHDERMEFPEPVYLGRFRYWRLADLETWERLQATRKAVAA
jgi:predicted DNA-binding transcriptional regulator AlpA